MTRRTRISQDRRTPRALQASGLLVAFGLSLVILAQTGCESGPDQAEEAEPVGGGPVPTEVERERPTQEEQATQIEVIDNPPVLEPLEESRLKNHHRDFDSKIGADNVDKLGYDWMVRTQKEVSHTPLVDDGTVYFADWGGNVWAVELETGKQVWKKKVQETVQNKWPWHGFAGTGTLSDDTLFEASVEGTAYAIDRETGEVKWSTNFAEDPQGGNLGKMTHYDGMVYIGVSSPEEMLAKKPGFEVNFRGNVVALDEDTGEIMWRRHLVEPPHNGVAVWSSFAIDPETNVLYFTTSNNYTGEASDMSDAVVAVDAKTGEVYWHDQVTQHDVWTHPDKKGPDFAFGAGPQLFEAIIDGVERKLMGAGQKSGVFYVWDRYTGERVWTVNVGYGHIGGGIHGEASIGADRLFIWGNNSFAYKNPKQHPMDIKAVDAATGKLLWVKTKAQPAVQIAAGFLADDVYLVPSMTGKVRGYHADTGEKLWTSESHGPIASSLWVTEGRLLWGSGVPPSFGGSKGPYGVVSYTLGE